MGYIYSFTNITNGKRYIGKTVKDVECRIRQHANKSILDAQSIFHKALKKYGMEGFYIKTWEIPNGQLSFAENNTIKQFNTIFPNGYNMTEGGEGTVGFKHSDETKKKLSEAWTGEKNPNFGKHHSEETKRKMSIRKKGIYTKEKHSMFGIHRFGEDAPFYGKTHTIKTKQKMSEAKKGDKHPFFGSTWHTGEKNPMFGRHHSPESIQKISEAKNKFKSLVR